MMPDDRSYCWVVARVDPGDDDIKRYIVWHHRYDPQRRERRHVVVAALDSEPEFLACLDGVRAGIEDRRERGEPVDDGEHASGVVHEPGHLPRAADGHLVSRAVGHGVAGPWIEELELPPNMSAGWAERPAR